MCRRSRAKMDQALPPLFVPAGQRSYVDYCAEGGRSLGTRLVLHPALVVSFQVGVKKTNYEYLMTCACSNYTSAGERV